MVVIRLGFLTLFVNPKGLLIGYQLANCFPVWVDEIGLDNVINKLQELGKGE